MTEAFDVAIVGAGPAGLAAALTLKKSGIDRLVVLERETEPGGVPLHCGHPPFGLREFGRLMTGPNYARRLALEAKAAGIAVRTKTTVRSLEPAGRMLIDDPDRGVSHIEAKRVLLATGVRETPRSARRISGSRPFGVLTTGALQAFIYLQKRIPFRSPVIIGTELVAFSALLTCRKAGIRPQAMIEENDRTTAAALLAAYPMLYRIPIRYRTRLLEIHGADRVEGVLIQDGFGRQESIGCDGVLFTGQFTPASELVRNSPFELDPATQGPSVDQYGRLSDPAYFAAGNLLRPVETSGWCYREGCRVAVAIASDLSGGLPTLDNMSAIKIGPGIKYAMPQRIGHSASEAPHASLQIRVTRPVVGRLVAEADGKAVWSKRVALRPERRFFLPIKALAQYLPAASLQISIV